MSKNKEKRYIVLTTSLLLTTVVFLGMTSATAEETTNKDKSIGRGMNGYYFYDKEQQELAYFNENNPSELAPHLKETSKLLNPGKTIQSAYWTGVLNTQEDGFTLDTSDNEHISLYVNGQKSIEQKKEISNPKLEKGKKYDVALVWEGEKLPDSISLFLVNDQKQKRTLTEKDWFIPKSEIEAKEQAQRSIASGKEVPKGAVDSDGDGIPNLLEMGGYLVDVYSGNYAAVPWMETAHQGLTRYTSSPQKWSTTSDPYSDFQKVSGKIDNTVSKETRNPLIAAYPIITTEMEQVILSKNITVITSQGGNSENSVTTNVSNSITRGIHTNFSSSMNASLFDLGSGLSASFGTSHSSTATLGHSNTSSQGQNWSESIQMNAADTAYLGATVRYRNIGTAPIYEVRPTISMVLGGNQTLATLVAKENQMGNTLTPGAQYPSKGHAGILFNKSDDFNSTPVIMNKDQVDLLAKTETLRMDTLQTEGKVGIQDDTGQIFITNNKWSTYLPQIDNSTARIILDDGKDQIERRIAATDPTVPIEQTIPVMNLEEALKLLYNINRDNNGNFFYEGEQLAEKDAFNLVMDKNTEKEFVKQLNTMGANKDIFKVELRAKMNLLVRPMLKDISSVKINNFSDQSAGQLSLDHKNKKLVLSVNSLSSIGNIKRGEMYSYFSIAMYDQEGRMKIKPQIVKNGENLSKIVEAVASKQFVYGDYIKIFHAEPTKLTLCGMNTLNEFPGKVTNSFFEITPTGLTEIINPD